MENLTCRKLFGYSIPRAFSKGSGQNTDMAHEGHRGGGGVGVTWVGGSETCSHSLYRNQISVFKEIVEHL